MLIRILEKRYGAAPQEVQVHSISELFQFSRGSSESTDSVIARFEILLHRAEGIGGVLFAPQLKAWMLLTHLRLPKASWFTLLAPTVGMLPTNQAEYTAFVQFVRRNGHLFDHGSKDSQKSIAQPFFADMHDGQPSTNTYFGANTLP